MLLNIRKLELHRLACYSFFLNPLSGKGNKVFTEKQIQIRVVPRYYLPFGNKNTSLNIYLKYIIRRMNLIKFLKNNYPIIIGILYFILPFDFIPDFILGMGQLDDIGILIFTLILNYFRARQKEKFQDDNNDQTINQNNAKDAEYNEKT